MRKEIIINSTINEVRIAITEEGKLAEFFIDLPNKERYIGNIYLGRVNKIVQGINAAFVDIGLNQDAFLHFSDIDESLENILDDEDEGAEFDDLLEDFNEEAPAENAKEHIESHSKKNKKGHNGNGKHATFNVKSGPVQINLEPKQNVIVQVVREAYGHKGVKISTKIALPGRYVVLLPFDKMMGVSKKIGSYQERRRLRQLAKNVLPAGFGCIIRTASKNQTEEELRKDFIELVQTWKEIDRKIKKAKEPTLLYQDMHLANSIIRDLFTPEVQRVLIDSKKLYREINNYVKWASPQLSDKIELYSGKQEIFDAMGIEKELASTYKRNVQLPGGGSIVVEQTEAMLVIDVNSGRSAEKDQEKNALKTNMEALREIARQIRLRDLGGMIIIDFIDMQEEHNRKKIFHEMKKELARDRAKTVVYPLTQLSLLQITRQRVNQNIVEKVSEICPMCKGRGRVTSKVVLINTIERWLKNFRKNSREFRLVLYVHPSIAAYITEGTFSLISKLMIRYFVKIKIQQDEHIHFDHFKFFSVKMQKDITNEYL